MRTFIRRARLLSVIVAGTLLTIAALPAEARRGNRINTQPGVLTLGGRFAFELMHVNPDPGTSETGVLLNFSPSFGGFVVKNLLLEGSLTAKVGLGDLYDNAAKLVGFAFGLQYLFDVRSIVVPYLGFRFGPAFTIPEVGDTAVALAFSFPAGILISLNEHVGLVIGTELAVSIGVSGPESIVANLFGVPSPGATIINLPVGYLGVNAYF